MKLLTKTLQSQLPELYTQEEVPDPLVRAHFFDPCGAANWFVVEGSEEDDDFVMFGLCDLGLGFPELGYVTINQLQAIRGPLGIGIERDLYWTPVPLSEVRAKHARAS